MAERDNGCIASLTKIGGPDATLPDCNKLNPDHSVHKTSDGRYLQRIVDIMLYEECHAFINIYSCASECVACSREHDPISVKGPTGHALAWQTLAYAVEQSFNKLCSMPVGLNRAPQAKFEAHMKGFRPDHETTRKLFDGRCPITDLVLPPRTLYERLLTKFNKLTNTRSA